MKLAIQMYNFVAGGDWDQVQTTEDVNQLLEKIAQAGFDGVEWLSFMLDKKGLDLKAIKQKMDALGLATCGMHYHCWNPATMEETCKTAADRCRLFESPYLTFAFSTPELFGINPIAEETAEIPEKAADIPAKGSKISAEAADIPAGDPKSSVEEAQTPAEDPDGPSKKKAEKSTFTPEQIDLWARKADEVLHCLKSQVQGTDIRVLYHNHAEEFRKGSDGRYFLGQIHPDAQELDVYWVAKGLDGKVRSALDYVRSVREQVAMLHLKDGLNGSKFQGEMCGWGKGTYPLQEIIDTGKDLGITWVVYENDAPLNFGTNGTEDARETGAYAAANIFL